VGPLEEIIEKIADKKPAEDMPRKEQGFHKMQLWKGSSLSQDKFGSDGSRQDGSDSRPSGSGNRGSSSDEDFDSDIPAPPGGELNGNDEGDFGGRGDNNRGIGDDQYRGE